MRTKLRVFNAANGIFRFLMSLFGTHNEGLIYTKLAEEIPPTVEVKTKFGILRFFCPNCETLCASSYLGGEKDTIEWIEGFEANSVFWDVGANIGIFSLYAAHAGKSKVVAFEPSASNYYVLAKNIEANGAADSVAAYCVALSDSNSLDYFYLTSMSAGSACHVFGKENNPSSGALKQAAIGYTMDDFIERYDPPFPNYLKVDVDGHERKVLAGAKKTLSDQRLKSIRIEIFSGDTKNYLEVKSLLENSGFKCIKEIEGVDGPAPHDNYIFARKEG